MDYVCLRCCILFVSLTVVQHQYQVFNGDQLELSQDQHINVRSQGLPPSGVSNRLIFAVVYMPNKQYTGAVRGVQPDDHHWRMVECNHGLCEMAERSQRRGSVGRKLRIRAADVWQLQRDDREHVHVQRRLQDVSQKVRLVTMFVFVQSPTGLPLRRYWEAQVAVGESVQGWIFWTWKVSGSIDVPTRDFIDLLLSGGERG